MEVDTTETLFSFYAWLHTNRKRVAAGAIVVVILAGTVTLWMWHNTQKEADASQQLLATLSSVTALQDHAKREALVNIARDYSDTIAGANAQLLAAKASFLDGKYAEAEQEFAKFVADHAGHELIPQAKVGLAASLEAQGKTSEAVAKYKEVAASYSSDQNIVLPVKLTLGRLSEALNKPDVAATYYEELARSFNQTYPNDPNNLWATEAGERLRLLFASHPELNPAATSKTSQPNLLVPSQSEMQIAPPSATPEAAPKPADAPKSNQNSPFLQMPTNLPPAVKP